MYIKDHQLKNDPKAIEDCKELLKVPDYISIIKKKIFNKLCRIIYKILVLEN